MSKTKAFIISSEAFHRLIVHPKFDKIGENFTGYYNGTLNEFTVYNDVPLAKGSPIIDFFSKRNLLQRKDGSCKTNWKQVAKGSTRKITIDELYGATEDCQSEFYQGCLKDYREHSPKFQKMILEFFKSSLGTDLASNSYFGDTTRANDKEWSLNQFDGIFVKYAKYIDNGGDLAPVVIDPIPSGVISPTEAYKVFSNAYKNQSYALQAESNKKKAFYASWDLAYGLSQYYQQIGARGGIIGYILNGMPTLDFEGIPVFVEPCWQPILNQLNNGNDSHALVLTLRGNFIFGTDDTYGGGAELDQSLRVWWSDDDEVWRYKMHLAAGTEIARPQDSVLTLTEIK